MIRTDNDIQTAEIIRFCCAFIYLFKVIIKYNSGNISGNINAGIRNSVYFPSAIFAILKPPL